MLTHGLPASFSLLSTLLSWSLLHDMFCYSPIMSNPSTPQPFGKQAYTADQIAPRLGWEQIDPSWIKAHIESARREDLEGDGLLTPPAHRGDVTTQVSSLSSRTMRATLRSRSEGCLAGLRLIETILEVYQAGTFTTDLQDGEEVRPGSLIGTLEGPGETLLAAERIVLNYLQHLSGIATKTREWVQWIEGSSLRLLDTRKTHPGMRLLEKFAFAAGGGYNHRLGLYDRVMFKDNHLAACGADSSAAMGSLIEKARRLEPGLPVEVEVDHLDQLEWALEGGCDIVLLDNFGEDAIERAVDINRGRVFLEVSGTVHPQRLSYFAQLGVDFVSASAPIHAAPWPDFGLDWTALP